jgi:hypothetical protein
MIQKEPQPRAPNALLTKEADGRLLVLPQDTAVVQMFPYGWQLPDGTVLREAEYAGMAIATNAGYWRWINPDAQHAFLRQCARWPWTCGLPVLRHRQASCGCLPLSLPSVRPSALRWRPCHGLESPGQPSPSC